LVSQVFVEKNLFFIFLGANKRKKQFRHKLSEKLKGIPFVPTHKRACLQLMLVFLLIGGMFVLFVRGDRQFFSLCFIFSWYGLGWYRVRIETPQQDICFFLGMEWEFWGGGARG
jgi:hypothetical protein